MPIITPSSILFTSWEEENRVIGPTISWYRVFIESWKVPNQTKEFIFETQGKNYDKHHTLSDHFKHLLRIFTVQINVSANFIRSRFFWVLPTLLIMKATFRKANYLADLELFEPALTATALRSSFGTSSDRDLCYTRRKHSIMYKSFGPSLPLRSL